MRQLTKKQIAAYVIDTSRCPLCRSEDLNSMGPVSGYTGFVHCKSCGAEWEDHYAIVNIKTYEKVPTALMSMTQKEISVQKALGTLPFREWMKLRGVILFDDWWYFPILGCKQYLMADPLTTEDIERYRKQYPDPTIAIRKMITINNIEYYPIADGYITDLQYSMAWNKWTEEEFAREIIAQCYACIYGEYSK